MIVSAGAQLQIREIKRTSPFTKEKYVFPVVVIPSNKAMATKINDELRRTVLDVADGVAENQIFNEVWGGKDFSASITMLSYEIERNSKGILSMKIEGDGCGAYCKGFEYDFLFNTQTGNLCHLDSLFTPGGLKKLNDSMNLLRGYAIKKQIKLANDSLRKAKDNSDSDDEQYFSEMVEMYTECLARDAITISDFLLLRDKPVIKVYMNRCSAHYNRNVDELWMFETLIDLKRWYEHLSDFGKKLVDYN
jgi:hypothetical protein